MSATASLIQVTLALMLMVGLILGLAWLAKRFGQPLFQQNKQLRLISSLSLGVKEKIILVEVEGKQLVLGVTPQQITALHVIDIPVRPEVDQAQTLNEKDLIENSETVKKSGLPEKTIASDFSKN
ncbi:MAG: flagellar biosynthetic protein FliO [Cellvibrio sp.]|nr:flagellar biosynthetic protein FliO [Cellvibrio sp.]